MGAIGADSIKVGPNEMAAGWAGSHERYRVYLSFCSKKIWGHRTIAHFTGLERQVKLYMEQMVHLVVRMYIHTRAYTFKLTISVTYA